MNMPTSQRPHRSPGRPSGLQRLAKAAHKPSTAEMHATSVLQQQDWLELERLSRQALAQNPKTEWALRYLPHSLAEQNRPNEADMAYAVAFDVIPHNKDLRLNRSSWLLDMSRTDDAIALLEPLAAENPTHAFTLALLGSAYYQSRSHQKGFAAAQQAWQHATTVAEKNFALQQLAIHRRELGQIDEAIANCEEGLKICPDDLAHHTNRMLFLLAKANVTNEQVLAAAQAYGQTAEGPWRDQWPQFEQTNREPNRKLKVGFLSPDFRNHSVMYFIEGLLGLLDREHFQVHALHLHPSQDGITQRVNRQVDVFAPMGNLSIDDQVKQLRELHLDIVIDLAGHTGYNGLPALARRVAPVQVSMLGYPATTGLTAVDYKISDPITDPANAEHFYVEKLWRLDTLFCAYRPCIRYPLYRYQPKYAVRPTPALANGHITFGSCTNLGRLTDEVLRTWAQILQQLPTAHLLIEGKDLNNPAFAQSYRQRCADLGLDVSRLTLTHTDMNNQYINYHPIDIVLDPFPLNSGTTSFDCVWMGVSFITLTGDSFKSRIGTGILTALGMNHCIAQTQADYVAKAVALASNVEQLNQTRLQLRKACEQSVLMHEAYYAQTFGNALRAMWWQWACPERIAPNGDTELQMPPPGPQTIAPTPGQRMLLTDAYARLEQLIGQAKQDAPDQAHLDGINHPTWVAVQDVAELILDTHTNDPVALSALAEIEQAHGHPDFAHHYLQCAIQAMSAMQTSAGDAE